MKVGVQVRPSGMSAGNRKTLVGEADLDDSGTVRLGPNNEAVQVSPTEKPNCVSASVPLTLYNWLMSNGWKSAY